MEFQPVEEDKSGRKALQSESSRWKILENFPCGPHLSAYLSGSGLVLRGQANGQDVMPVDFGSALMDFMAEQPIANSEVLIEVVDELVAMDLPLAALATVDLHRAIWSVDDFRANLAEGVAAMLVEELERAERCFRLAQEQIPEEPAPYVNLVQIFLHQDRREDGLVWCHAGLQAAPNHFALWDYYRELHGQLDVAEQSQLLEKKAKELQSWAGVVMSAGVLGGEGERRKMELLDGIYQGGEREGEFLIEYTGALGAVGRFAEIPQVIWQAEKGAPSALPWQLYVHGAQANLALANEAQFQKILKFLQSRSDVPGEMISHLEELAAAEFAESAPSQ